MQDNSKLDIVIHVGDGMEVWTPETVKKTGIGGSELMAIEISKRLAALGHKVRVYSGCGDTGEGIYDGVEYRKSYKYQDIVCDVLIVSRNAAMIDDSYNITAKLKLLWVHDVWAGNATNERLLKYDRILALTNWHKGNIVNAHNVHPDHVLVTRNGIDLSRFDRKDIVRNQYKCVNSSSPDRSWPVLLNIWPTIRTQVPEAELHLYYGFKNWEKAAVYNPGQPELIERLKKQIEDLKPLGVVYHDRISQKELSEEFLSAGVWVHPTWFSETSCQLAGSLIFTKNGMKPIEEVMVGDLVLTHRGRFRAITKLIQKEYNGKLYSIKRRKDFNPITLTEEHPLLTATFHKRADSLGGRVYSYDNLNIKWETPENIVPKRNYLMSPKMKFGNLTRLKFSDYIDLPVDENGMIGPKIKRRSNYKYIKNDVDITTEFMYMMGLFAAEGCCSDKRGKQKPQHCTIVFAMHLKEIKKAQQVIDYFGCGKIKRTSKKGISIILHHSVWAKFFASQIGVGKAKRIPAFVWETSKEHQHAFMRGMFEGDGCIKTSNDHNNAKKRYKSADYTSISPSLAYGIAQLLANQGIYASITFSVERDAYVLNWQLESKCPQHIMLNEGYATRVTNVNSQDYNGIVYNFEVDEDESYVTDRTIVHNCITAMEAQAAGLRMITSPIAALNETIADRGLLIPGEWTSKEYQDKFISAVVAAIKYNDDSDRVLLQQYAKNNFELDDLSKDWNKMFHALIELKQKNPIVPYFPTKSYQ